VAASWQQGHIPVISCHDPALISALLTRDALRRRLVDQAAELALRRSNHGVAIDFGAVPERERTAFTGFLTQLHRRIGQMPPRRLVVTTPPRQRAGTVDPCALAPSADWLLVRTPDDLVARDLHGAAYARYARDVVAGLARCIPAAKLVFLIEPDRTAIRAPWRTAVRAAGAGLGVIGLLTDQPALYALTR
jgi:hypothetical protein